MKKHCLPCHLIVGNVVLLLVAIASTVLLTADIYASSNPQNPQSMALKRLFAYQMLLNADDGD